MRWIAAPACLALATWAGAGFAADPMQAQGCRAARAELEAATTAAAGAHAGLTARSRHARERAAVECLGHDSPPRERTGTSQSPLEVPAPRIEPPRGVATGSPPLSAMPLPPLEISRPVPVGACDPGGCWDANGQRLNSFGPSPVLIGPNGSCVVTNGFATCR